MFFLLLSSARQTQGGGPPATFAESCGNILFELGIE